MTTNVSHSARSAGIGGKLGHLKGQEDLVPQVAGVLDRLHPGRKLREVIAPEVGVGGPGGHYQRVVVQIHWPPVRPVRAHQLLIEVELVDVGEEGARVALLL